MDKHRSGTWPVVIGLATLGLMGAIPALAHHGTAASYDQKKLVTLKGTVSEFLWKNPHCALFLDVKDESGKVVNYSIEMFSPNLMVGRGYTKTVLKRGDEVTIEVHPSLAGTPSGECLGCKLLVNGKVLAIRQVSSPTNNSAMRPHAISAILAALVLPPAARAQKPAPDLSGVYTRSGGGGAANPMSEWSAETLPFTPEGLARFNANKPGKGPRQVPPALGNDTLGDSNPPALYRTLIYNRPFEIVQTPGKVIQLFEWAKAWRVIWTDGRSAPDDLPAGPYWYGYSVGKWEGDTLVVETVGLDERAWLDEWGTPFSGDAHIEERWKRTGPDRIELTITVRDPALYAKPWTSSPVVYSSQRKTEVLEMIFAPIDEKEFNKRVRDPAAGVGKK